MNKKTLIILLIIISLGFFLRIYNLTKSPPSPDWDEAALGYNAYSILKTGRDEFGNFLPLSLKSFNDYKPAFYTYTAIPSIALFGLSVFSTRLPSIIMGTLTILGVFFFSEAFRKLLVDKKLSVKFSLLCSLLIAISPWHLQFSRAAFEANSALFLVVWGAFFLLHSLTNGKLLIPAAIFYSLSLYAYHSTRIFVPLILLGFTVIFRERILAIKKYLIISVIMGFIISLPAIGIALSPEGQKRFAGVSVYSDQTGLLRESVVKAEQDRIEGVTLGNLWHNRRFVYVSKFLENYLWHFTPKWLFLTGDGIGRHHAPDMGLLYLFELPFILIGVFQLMQYRSKAKWFVVIWFLVAPLAAAPTNQVPHAIRSYFFLPIFQIFSALGIISFYSFVKRTRYYYPIVVMTGLICILNFIYYLDMYHNHLAKEYSQAWQYGYEEAIKETEKIALNYDKIIYSGKLEQPYIFYLFYTKYNPQKYLNSGGSTSIDFNNWSHLVLGKYEFKYFDWNKEKKEKNTLYIGRPQDFGDGGKVIKTIFYLDNTPAILLVET